MPFQSDAFQNDSFNNYTYTGTGTSGDPYVLYSLDDLEMIPTLGLDKYYKLANDIDASATALESYNGGAGWAPRGWLQGFFDGNNKTISGLYINRPTTDSVGLFSGLSNASDSSYVKNLTVKGTVIGQDSVGLITGSAYKSQVVNCKGEGSVTGRDFVGGIIGSSQYPKMDHCHFKGTVTGRDGVGGIAGLFQQNSGWTCVVFSSEATISGRNNVGGLIGSFNDAPIAKAWSSGSVSSTGNYVGGLLGSQWAANITNCYSHCSVSGVSRVGGLVGFWQKYTITNCYAKGSISGSTNLGGLVGYAGGGAASNSFWDTETSGQSSSALGTGKTTAEMKLQATYTSWDFATPIWVMDCLNSGYPYLSEISPLDYGYTEICGVTPSETLSSPTPTLLTEFTSIIDSVTPSISLSSSEHIILTGTGALILSVVPSLSLYELIPTVTATIVEVSEDDDGTLIIQNPIINPLKPRLSKRVWQRGKRRSS